MSAEFDEPPLKVNWNKAAWLGKEKKLDFLVCMVK